VTDKDVDLSYPSLFISLFNLVYCIISYLAEKPQAPQNKRHVANCIISFLTEKPQASQSKRHVADLLFIVFSPDAQLVQDIHQGSAPFAQPIFHFWRYLRILCPNNQMIRFQLLQVKAECFV
jgi:hypothetical protein